MAARWVGLTRPNKRKFARAVARRGIGHTIHEFLHAVGAVGVLAMAAAVNFALYPDAIAAVMSGERAPIINVLSIDPALVAAQTPSVAPLPVDETEVRLLAATAWGEARSEGESGMRAVAHVMVNRVGPRFGENLSTVILSPKQFSVWNRGDPNRRLVLNLARDARYARGDAEWETAQRVAREVLSAQSVDPTDGALFYHTQAVRPRWAPHGRGRKVIGAHIFYADVRDPGVRATPRVIDIAQIFNAPAERARSPQRRRGPRAGRVHGRIQHAPVGAPNALPPPTTVITSPAPVNTVAATATTSSF